MNTNFRVQSGFTLIEVLIALLVSSVGLLGFAATQVTSLKNTDHSYLSSQASILSFELFDRMRANHDAATNEEYDIALSALTDLSTPEAGSSIALQDRFRWFSKLDSVLPNGKASINCNNTAVCSVNIQWSNLANPDEGDWVENNMAAQI